MPLPSVIQSALTLEPGPAPVFTVLIDPTTGTPYTAGILAGSDSAAQAVASRVAAAAGDTQILAARPARKGRPSVFYDGAGVLYLLAGSGVASTSNYTLKLGAGYMTLWEPAVANYTGEIRGLWVSPAGHAYVTEYV